MCGPVPIDDLPLRVGSDDGMSYSIEQACVKAVVPRVHNNVDDTLCGSPALHQRRYAEPTALKGRVNFGELRTCEVRRIPRMRTSQNSYSPTLGELEQEIGPRLLMAPARLAHRELSS